MASLLGSGTSPNESLHAEINRWFRNQPEVFPSTLSLQLEVGRLGKLVCHNAAMYLPTLRQFGQDVALAATTAGITFDQARWAEWNASSRPLPAARPLTWAHKALQARLRAAGRRPKDRVVPVHVVMKRPACIIPSKRPAACSPGDTVVVLKRPAASEGRAVKRTPFSLKRHHA